MPRRFAVLFQWTWRQFRRLPLVLQWLFGSICLGAFAMAAFVGNMGLALMGTAIALSGAVIGGVLGAVAVLVPWGTAAVYRAKRQERALAATKSTERNRSGF